MTVTQLFDLSWTMVFFSEISVLQLQSALGLVAFPLIAWLLSKRQQRPNIKLWISAIGIQLVLALLFLRLPFFQSVFTVMNKGVLAIERASQPGISFVFGYLGGGTAPFEVTNHSALYIIGIRALPLILVIGSLTSLL